MIVGTSVHQVAGGANGRIGRRYVTANIQRANVEQAVGRLSIDEDVIAVDPNCTQADVSHALQLIAEIDARDISASEGASISTWTARTGPNWVQDTSFAYGLPTYSATSLGGTKPGLTCVQASCMRLMAASVYAPAAYDRTFVFVHAPSQASATANTRCYLYGSTEDNTIQGTRLVIGHNANTSGSYDRAGWYDNNLASNETGQNTGWHWFWDETGAGATLATGVQISIFVFGLQTFWMRNGVIRGFGLPCAWRTQPRSAAYKAVLWSDHNADPSNSATFYDGVFSYFADYYGAATYAQALSIHNALAAIWL